MKKIVVLLGVVSLCATAAIGAQAAKKMTISNTRIIPAIQQTTLGYGDVDMTVPQNQPVVLGQRSDSLVVTRGKDLADMKINNALVSTKGYSVFSIDPKNNVLFLNRGSELTLTDPSGKSVTIYPGQAVYMADASITSETAQSLKEAAAQEAAAVAGTELDPSYVLDFDSLGNNAAQQAEEDVLSPSAPH